MSKTIHDYRDLNVWQKSRVLVKRIYDLTSQFPPMEKYGLTSQIQRAVISIPTNIAEGNARTSSKEYAQFIAIAAGSAAETETLLTLAADLNFIKEEDGKKLIDDIIEIRKMLNALRKSLVA